MNKLPKIAISIGDLNGIGIEIALKSHESISTICKPIYCINDSLLKQASKLLNMAVPNDFTLFETKGNFSIKAGKVSKKSGKYSYNSFLDAIKLADKKLVDAICTLAINKEAWSKAKIKYKGHTEVLRDYFQKNAIMMLGCEKLFVGLYTEHIPLKDIKSKIKKKKIQKFLIDFYQNVKNENIAVLGLNPHAGDNGVLGNEEFIISKAIKSANKTLKKNIFKGPLVPDIAFSPFYRQKFKYFVAMYHDQGLAPLKALYFDESINVSLNLPIIRTSVDHGTAFDIAYKNANINTQSYINAIKEAINLLSKKDENSTRVL